MNKNFEELAFPSILAESTYKPVWAKNTKTNHQYLQRMLSNPTLSKVMDIVNRDITHELMAVRISDNSEFLFVPGEYKGVTFIQYGVRIKSFKLVGVKGIESTIGQVSVWRNKEYSLLQRGFAVWIFRNILFPLHHHILSDNQQSLAGKNFWVQQIDYALSQNMFVWALKLKDLNTKKLEVEQVNPVTSLKHIDRYYSQLPQDDKGSYYRFLITKTRLELA